MIFLKTEERPGIEFCNTDLYQGVQIKAVLFDMDGVILDTEKLYVRFWQEAATFYGYEMTYEMALGMRSLNPALGMARMKEYFGPFVDYQMIRNKRMQLMELFVSQYGVDAKPGICELLEFLKENKVKSAVATSSPPDRARYYLAYAGVLSEFEGVASAHRVKKGKPEPDVFLYAVEKLGLQPEECLVLEDSSTGLLAAYRAGCVPVMVPDLDQPDDEVKGRIFAVVQNLMTIIDMIEVIPDPEEEEELEGEESEGEESEGEESDDEEVEKTEEIESIEE